MSGSGASACILWHLSRGSHGYGQMRRRGRTLLAHRHVYAECLGPIPPGMHVHHRCGNRACVNPEHMELLTKAEHHRHHNLRPLVCRNGHVRTAANTYRRPDGSPACRECRYIAEERKRDCYAA